MTHEKERVYFNPEERKKKLEKDIEMTRGQIEETKKTIATVRRSPRLEENLKRKEATLARLEEEEEEVRRHLGLSSNQQD